MKSRIMFLAVVLLAAGCNDQELPKSSPPAAKTAPTLKSREVVKLTPKALEKIREVQKMEGKPYLRVSVISAGSTGFKYDLKMDDQFDPTKDILNDSDSVKVVVDARSSLFLQDATIDWQTTPDGRQGFKFDNPNALKEPADSQKR